MNLALGDRLLNYKVTGRGTQSLLLLPGGPGFTYESLSIIHTMLSGYDIMVISYNPSGVGDNKTAPFYKSVSAYTHELDDVIKALNLQHVFLLGHSWGTAIVQEYLALYPNKVLNGVILVNMFSSGVALARAINARANDLPSSFQEQYRKALREGNGEALDACIGEHWFPKFICRMPELPQDIISAASHLRDTPAYYYYVGSNVFNLKGALLEWDRSENLTGIKIPTLIMSGEYDYSTKTEIEALTKAIPHAALWYESDVSHFPMYEKPDSFKAALIQFLKANGKF